MTSQPVESTDGAVEAQAHLHHAYLLGLQLMVARDHANDVVEDWIFRLFRRQHEEKFLSSFSKLGLEGLPDAVACARYHVLSNSIGGVGVEYLAESDTKAWVRFRYPRWMFAGAAICGVPVGASRGFLRGWYAQNGVTLGNPRLGFVCVSEDMTGEFGFCGYFREYPEALSDDQRLQFAREELPPAFDADAQPRPPTAEWSPERLEKAYRNYAVEYIRNGLQALAQVLGADVARDIGKRAGRLIGLQYYPDLARRVGAHDGDAADAAHFLAAMFAGLGDETTVLHSDARDAELEQRGLRVLRGLDDASQSLLFECWAELWVGAIRSHRELLDVVWERVDGATVRWRITARRSLA
ncbi:MAG: hypothetical protein AAF458_09405 [Pseudomonadota bacterium]